MQMARFVQVVVDQGSAIGGTRPVFPETAHSSLGRLPEVSILPSAFLNHSFQCFHPERLEASVIVEGDLSQLPVQVGREPEQHPFRRARFGAARCLWAGALVSAGRSMHCVGKTGFTLRQESRLRGPIQTVH